MKYVGPILLVSIIGALYVTSAFVVFDWDQSWRGLAVSAFLVFGLWAMTYEVGFKTYWQSMHRLTFALVFAVPTAVASIVLVWRLLRL